LEQLSAGTERLISVDATRAGFLPFCLAWVEEERKTVDTYYLYIAYRDLSNRLIWCQ